MQLFILVLGESCNVPEILIPNIILIFVSSYWRREKVQDLRFWNTSKHVSHMILLVSKITQNMWLTWCYIFLFYIDMIEIGCSLWDNEFLLESIELSKKFVGWIDFSFEIWYPVRYNKILSGGRSLSINLHNEYNASRSYRSSVNRIFIPTKIFKQIKLNFLDYMSDEWQYGTFNIIGTPLKILIIAWNLFSTFIFWKGWYFSLYGT